LLDTWNYSKHINGIDHELQELAITVAASFAVWALDEGYMVGLFSNSSMLLFTDDCAEDNPMAEANSEQEKSLTRISSPGVHIPFASDHGQYERILSTMARLVPDYNSHIERFIDRNDDLFPIGTTVVLVSAASTLNDATAERLHDLRIRGAAVHLVLVGEPDEARAKEIYDLPVHYSGGREKWHELTSTVGAGANGILGTSSTHLQLD
jgi:hypothetical protein